jgi:hypothetical protein
VRLSYAEGGNTYVYSTVRSLGTLQVVERLEWGREQFPGLTAWGRRPSDGQRRVPVVFHGSAPVKTLLGVKPMKPPPPVDPPFGVDNALGLV